MTDRDVLGLGDDAKRMRLRVRRSGARPLRCQVCGRAIGVVYGYTPPDLSMASWECCECAAACEARRALDTDGEALRDD